MILQPKCDPVEYLRGIEKHRATDILCVPTMTVAILEHPDAGLFQKPRMLVGPRETRSPSSPDQELAGRRDHRVRYSVSAPPRSGIPATPAHFGCPAVVAVVS